MVVIRRNININLSDEDHLALRHILLAEGKSMAEFFGSCARQYIFEKHGIIPSDALRKKFRSQKPKPK